MHCALPQGSGQPPITAQASGPDRIEIKAVGATLRQNGQVLDGKKR